MGEDPEEHEESGHAADPRRDWILKRAQQTLKFTNENFVKMEQDEERDDR